MAEQEQRYEVRAIGPLEIIIFCDGQEVLRGHFNGFFREKLRELVALANSAVSLKEERDRLRVALKELTDACVKDFAGPSMEDFKDSDRVGGGGEGDMAITFGMIRRAQAALADAALSHPTKTPKEDE